MNVDEVGFEDDSDRARKELIKRHFVCLTRKTEKDFFGVTATEADDSVVQSLSPIMIEFLRQFNQALKQKDSETLSRLVQSDDQFKMYVMGEQQYLYSAQQLRELAYCLTLSLNNRHHLLINLLWQNPYLRNYVCGELVLTWDGFLRMSLLACAGYFQLSLQAGYGEMVGLLWRYLHPFITKNETPLINLYYSEQLTRESQISLLNSVINYGIMFSDNAFVNDYISQVDDVSLLREVQGIITQSEEFYICVLDMISDQLEKLNQKMDGFIGEEGVEIKQESNRTYNETAMKAYHQYHASQYQSVIQVKKESNQVKDNVFGKTILQ